MIGSWSDTRQRPVAGLTSLSIVSRKIALVQLRFPLCPFQADNMCIPFANPVSPFKTSQSLIWTQGSHSKSPENTSSSLSNVQICLFLMKVIQLYSNTICGMYTMVFDPTQAHPRLDSRPFARIYRHLISARSV